MNAIVKKIVEWPHWWGVAVAVTLLLLCVYILRPTGGKGLADAVKKNEEVSAALLMAVTKSNADTVLQVQKVGEATQVALERSSLELEKRLSAHEDSLRSQLETIASETAGALAQHEEEIRRNYEDLLLTPEHIGPVFDDLFSAGPAGGTCPIDGAVGIGAF